MPRDDSHANLYSGNVTLLPFVSEDEEEEEEEDATARTGTKMMMNRSRARILNPSSPLLCTGVAE